MPPASPVSPVSPRVVAIDISLLELEIDTGSAPAARNTVSAFQIFGTKSVGNLAVEPQVAAVIDRQGIVCHQVDFARTGEEEGPAGEDCGVPIGDPDVADQV